MLVDEGESLAPLPGSQIFTAGVFDLPSKLRNRSMSLLSSSSIPIRTTVPRSKRPPLPPLSLKTSLRRTLKAISSLDPSSSSPTSRYLV